MAPSEPEQGPGSEPEQGTRGTAAFTGGLAAGRKLLAEKIPLLRGWLRRQGLPKVSAGVAGLVLLVILAWWLSSALAGGTPASAGQAEPTPSAAPSTPPSRGALPLEGVSPLDFRLGDCFKDFDPEATQASVVACDTAHSAQLVAIGTYAAEDSYPGREPLKQKALDVCKGAPLTDKSAGYDVSYKLAYPSSSSWGTGDRRVDCFVTAAAGNAITESLLPAP